MKRHYAKAKPCKHETNDDVIEHAFCLEFLQRRFLVHLNKSRYHFNVEIHIYLYLRIQTSHTHTHTRVERCLTYRDRRRGSRACGVSLT